MAGAHKRVESDSERAGAVTAPMGVVAFSLDGLITFGVLSATLTRARQSLTVDPNVSAVVFDLSRVDGFEPGLPAKIVQWAQEHADRVRAVAIVSTRTVWGATTRAATFMVPGTLFCCVPTRRDAFAAVGAVVSARTRVSTGTRPRLL